MVFMARDKRKDEEQTSLDLDSDELMHIKGLYEEKMLLRAYELTSKNKVISMVLAFFCAPMSYAYIKRYDFMLISLLTFNYFLLGFIIAPLHVYYLYNQAEERLKSV